MSNRTLCVLGAQRMQVAAIETARRMGLRVIAIDPSPSAPGLPLADEAYVFDVGDVERCIDVARACGVAGVVTLAADFPMPTLGAMCAELSLPGPSVESVECATNKRSMRSAFEAAGVAGPRSVPVRDREQAREIYTRLGGAVVIKPVLSSGGRGVSMVERNSPGHCVDAAFDRALQETRADGVLVEDYVAGPEFSVELLSWDGEPRVVAVTDKITTGPPYFVEIGHSQPSLFCEMELTALTRTACEGMRALGLDWCAGHAELRLNEDGAQVMEIAGRLGGGFITTDLVPASTGIDLVAATIRVALGERPNLAANKRCGAAVRFIDGPRGRVLDVHGVEDARSALGCTAAELYVGRGDEVTDLRDARGRIGHVICVGADAVEALARSKDAMERIAIEVMPS